MPAAGESVRWARHAVVSGRRYWQVLPVHRPLRHWLPIEHDWPLFDRQAVPPALHVEFAAQPTVVPGVQLVAQLVAVAQARLFAHARGVLGPQLPAPLQVTAAVKIAPEQEGDPHIVEDE